MTDDEEKPCRPNAKYKLSNEDRPFNPEEDKLTFYYNRERRLAKAPPSVKNLYEMQKKSVRFNLLRPLVADKPRLISFIVIVVMCVAITVFAILGFFDTPYSLEGNNIEAGGTVVEGTTIVVLRKTVKDNAPYSGAVDITVSAPVQLYKDAAPFSHRVFFTNRLEEEYRFVVPFDSPELLMVVQAGKSSVKIRFKPE